MKAWQYVLKYKELVETFIPNGVLHQYIQASKRRPTPVNPLKYSSIKATTELLRLKSVVEQRANPTHRTTYDMMKSYTIDLSAILDIPKEEFENEVKVKQSQVKRIITDIYNDNSLFLKIQPREFEEVINELLRHQGYDTELTAQTRDGGFDIIALKTIALGIPIKMLVECKRHKSKIGIDVIRSFKDVIATENANLGMLVTTSYFTRDAIAKQQKSKFILALKDKNDIVEWTNDYIINPFGKSSL